MLCVCFVLEAAYEVSRKFAKVYSTNAGVVHVAAKMRDSFLLHI